MLFSAIAFVILTSCQNDDEYDYSPLTSTPSPLIPHHSSLTTDGYTMLSMKVRMPAPATDEDEYFQNEYLISRFELFLFDAQTKEYVDKAIINDPIPAEELFNNLYDITYLFKSLRVKVGRYDMFAIANYEKTPEEIKDENEFLNMIDSISYPSGVEPYISDKGAIMTSRATAMLNVDLTPWNGKEYYITIDLERVLAKLQIGVAKEYFELKNNGNKYADIKITNYKLVNLSKRFYLFQHTDRMTELDTKPDFQMPTNFGEYQEDEDRYIVDPMFYKKTTSTSDAQSFNNYYASWFGNFNTSNFASITAVGKYGYAYILENTSFKDSQKNGYSAGIVFKASVSPVFVYLYDSKTFSLIKEHRPEYWGDVIYVYNYNFYGSIQAINAASELMLDELETYDDRQLQQYGIKKCNFNQGVYETYYTYWIQHRKNPADNNGSMSYGVVRNNFYKIIITGISDIGHSMIVPDIMHDNNNPDY